MHTFHVCSLHFKCTDLIIRGNRKTIVKGGLPSIFQCIELDLNGNVGESTNDELGLDLGATYFDDEQQQPELLVGCGEQTELHTNME